MTIESLYNGFGACHDSCVVFVCEWRIDWSKEIKVVTNINDPNTIRNSCVNIRNSLIYVNSVVHMPNVFIVV